MAQVLLFKKCTFCHYECCYIIKFYFQPWTKKAQQMYKVNKGVREWLSTSSLMQNGMNTSAKHDWTSRRKQHQQRDDGNEQWTKSQNGQWTNEWATSNKSARTAFSFTLKFYAPLSLSLSVYNLPGINGTCYILRVSNTFSLRQWQYRQMFILFFSLKSCSW